MLKWFTVYLLFLQMATFQPLIIVTAVVLLCGAFTGEAGLKCIAILYHFFGHTLHSTTTPLCQTQLQVPRKLFATSKPTRTTPTSPSPGTLWMATTPPPTSITTIYYRDRPYAGYRSSIRAILYSDCNLIMIGSSFQYTITVTSFSTYGQYVMWLYVYRSTLNPS